MDYVRLKLSEGTYNNKCIFIIESGREENAIKVTKMEKNGEKKLMLK